MHPNKWAASVYTRVSQPFSLREIPEDVAVVVAVLIFRVDKATGPEGFHVIGDGIDGARSEWVTHRLKIKKDWLRPISRLMKNLMSF